MTAPPVAVVDTSVFVAREAGRAVRSDLLPDQSVVSVITVAELRAGVLAAAGTASASARLATMEAVDEIALLDIDTPVAHVWAEMRVHLAHSGRRVNVNDLWIAATAAANNMPVVTQDADFDAIEGVASLRVIQL